MMQMELITAGFHHSLCAKYLHYVVCKEVRVHGEERVGFLKALKLPLISNATVVKT